MARILVVEDNPALADGLRVNLEVEGHHVRVAATGPDGLAAARAEPGDLVVLDLMLPGLDGERVLETLRRDGVRTPVLVLTARGAEADKLRGFRLGADDYVTKPFALAELLARVAALLRRAAWQGAAHDAAPAVLRLGDVEVEPAARVVRRAGAPVALSPKAFDLLLALWRRRGRTAGREELLREVWGYGEGVVTRTLDAHVCELRQRIEPDPGAPRYVRTVWRRGYRLDA